MSASSFASCMFESEVYVQRRDALRLHLGTGVVLFPGNELMPMNYKSNTFPFRQDGSFLYFAGINQPGLFLCLDCESGEEVLCGPNPRLSDTIWNGPAPGLEELAAKSGIRRTGTMEDAAALCRRAAGYGRTIHYLPTYQGDQTLKLAEILGLDAQTVALGASRNLIAAVVALRSVKSDEEIREISKAIALSAEMYSVLMAACHPGVSEMHLYGRLQGLALSHGSSDAFPMILSKRGEVLHNHAHDQILSAGDLLLVDSGVQSPRYYASDITRTIPVGGRFLAKQRDIYSVVLSALKAGTALMRPGVSFLECHLCAAKAIAAGLCDLKLMRGEPEQAVHAGAHALFFPHGLGHMLGLDVHDMEGLGENFVGYDTEHQRSTQFGLSGLRMARRLQPGFVLTVEPGIYFIPALIAHWRAQRLHEEFINYSALDDYADFGGIRIEDDVAVVADGATVLSASIPKEVDAIEKCMAEGV